MKMCNITEFQDEIESYEPYVASIDTSSSAKI